VTDGVGVGRILEAMGTGIWLGLVQVALGFAVLGGAGASAVLFFGLTAAWIFGGALGVTWVRGRAGILLLAFALAVAAVARLWLLASAFDTGATICAFIAAMLCGAYAGSFFAARANIWQDSRRLLLHENNGFLLGLTSAAVSLLLIPSALDPAALTLGLALLAARLVWDRKGR
jgi:hypothetical protein